MLHFVVIVLYYRHLHHSGCFGGHELMFPSTCLVPEQHWQHHTALIIQLLLQPGQEMLKAVCNPPCKPSSRRAAVS